MTQKIRVRFAPSPTGPLHIGGVRTALFNYLFAKKHGGDFILRIEDTDQKRFVKGAEAYITQALDWCGIPYDEGVGKEGDYGPYRQSERNYIYKKYVDQLIANKAAYYAFDTPEKLDFHRKEHEQKGKTFIYNWHNRLKLDNSLNMGPDELNSRLDSGEEYVVRFYTEPNKKLKLDDAIRGQIEIDSNVLDDKILFKSDGTPTYHLANVVDDHLMKITHVIRGEEWLPSLALHWQLYDAFAWKKPTFAHLPLILKPIGKGKLSKRDGEKGGFPVFPLSWETSVGYKETGYYPEAVVNFLALLGWNPGTEQELFSLKQLIDSFSLERVTKSGARFDPEKTKWYNHHYLQQKSNKILAKSFYTEVREKAGEYSLDYVEKVVSLIKERATFVADFWDLSHFFFVDPTSYHEKSAKKQWKEGTKEIMLQLSEVLHGIPDFEAENVTVKIKQWITAKNYSFGKVMPPLRLVIVGDMKGPDLFQIMTTIGREKSIKRINNAIQKLG